MAQGFAFVSHDGQDEKGVRAEVWVQKGLGEIKNITPHENGKVAQVEIKTEGLKFSQKAWINVESEQFRMLQEAYDERKPVNYRIESQRKLKNSETKEEISRETPIQELRTSTEVARANTKTVLVGVNDSLTDEAVTHPKEDPSSAGRRPAADPDANKAPAPQQQTQQYNISERGRRLAKEGTPYEEFNPDGSRNFGSYKVHAAVATELFVRKQLSKINPDVVTFEEDILSYSAALLSIADSLQAYFTKKGVDRMANSHTRIRSVIFDTVEFYHPIPEKNSARQEWFSAVGKEAQTRFLSAMRLDSEPFDRNAFFAGEVQNAPKTEINTPDNGQSEALREEAPAAKAPEEEKSVLEKSRPKAPVQDEAPAPERAVSAPAKSSLLSSAKNFSMFPQTKIEPNPDGEALSPELMESFKEFATESKVDLSKLTKLLIYTFGVEKAVKVPDEPFEEFLDFYIEAGDENFLAAVDYAASMV